MPFFAHQAGMSNFAISCLAMLVAVTVTRDWAHFRVAHYLVRHDIACEVVRSDDLEAVAREVVCEELEHEGAGIKRLLLA